MTIPVYVINRACDEDRMARFAEAAGAQGVDFTRIEAIDGHDPQTPLFLYRDYLREGFWGEAEIKPGAFACALSHRAAWMRMLADGVDAALILEDDAPPAMSLKELKTAVSRTADWDVIFANGRMAAWCEVGALKRDARALPLEKIAGRIAKAGEAPSTPGADAYLVSRRGAEALLAMLSDTGVVAGVDWLMVAHSLAPGAPPGPEAALLAKVSQDPPRLRSLVLRDAFADARGGERSVVEHKRTVPIADLKSGASIRLSDDPVEGGGAVAPTGLRSDPVADAFAGERFYEEPALEMMMRWMPRGGVFVDIGAHIGGHSLFMLLHGGAGRAIPFEHNRFAVEAMRELIRLNGIEDRVDVSHLGLGLAEEIGRREARGAKRNPFAQRLKRGFDEGVRVRPGDALLREEPVDMIKLDVNGEEREVLKGLRKTLKRKSPLLAIDLSHPRAGKCAPLLERLGYGEVERAEWMEGEAKRTVSLLRAAGVATKVEKP